MYLQQPQRLRIGSISALIPQTKREQKFQIEMKVYYELTFFFLPTRSIINKILCCRPSINIINSSKARLFVAVVFAGHNIPFLCKLLVSTGFSAIIAAHQALQAEGVRVLSGEHSSALSCNLYGDSKVQVRGYGEGQEAEAPSGTHGPLWKRVLLSCAGADVPH